jgi:dihydrodipicolinate synthase/N-acetylneuraminate lyase
MSNNIRARRLRGIVVQGSTGEAILLSDDERRDVLKCARDSAAPNEKS